MQKLPIACAAAMLMLTLFLASCSDDSGTAPAPLTEPSPALVDGDIDVWSWNIAAESLKAILPDYIKSHPNAKVNVDMTGANMQMRFMLSLAAGTGAPDVSQLQLTDAPHYIATGRLMDLTPVAAKYQSLFPSSLWQSCVSHGRVYAIPWDMGPCAIFYKRAVFQKYGIDPTKIDTWDDFITAGQKIDRLSHGATKMMPLGPEDMINLYFILLQQSGGQVFDGQGRIAINSIQAQGALNVAKKLRASGICSNVTQYSQEWMSGINDDSIATYPGAVWLAGMISDTTDSTGKSSSEWGVFRLPAITHGGLHVANNGGSVLVIPEQSTQKEAAWSFIEWALCSKEGQIEQYQKKSLFPAFLPAMRSAQVSAPQPFFGGQKAGALFAMDVEKIPHLNMTPQWDEATDYMAQSLSHWCATGMNDPHLLRDLALKLRERLDVPLAPGAGS